MKVLNDRPRISADAKPTADDRLALVTTTLTDGGPLDTQTATYDWGDGTPAETFPCFRAPDGATPRPATSTPDSAATRSP